MFSVQVVQKAKGVVFVLHGELDFHSVVQVHEAGQRELARERENGLVVLDCAALSFCDSTGISTMVRLHQQLAGQGRALRLAGLSEVMVCLFSVTGLDQLFAVHADAEEALAAAAGRHDTESAGPVGPAQPKERQKI
ncbi:STAS domain-containing protein [Streptomyces microflavus]